jgi:hypothetical protein
MSAATQLEYDSEEPLTAIAHAEMALADLLVHFERLHRANIQHEPHSCFVCFEAR